MKLIVRLAYSVALLVAVYNGFALTVNMNAADSAVQQGAAAAAAAAWTVMAYVTARAIDLAQRKH